MRHTTICSMLFFASLAIPSPVVAQVPTDQAPLTPPTEGTETAPMAEPVPPPPAPLPPPTPEVAATVAPEEERWTDNAGHLGVGGEALLGGAVGLQARYQLSDGVDLGLTFGTLVASASAGEADFSQTSVFAGFGGAFRILTAGSTAIGIMGDLNILSTSTKFPDVDGDIESSSLTFGLGVGLQAELFLASFVSLHGQTGLRLAIASGESGGDDTSGFSLSLAGDLVTGFGFTFWL
ncbi:MAG: hypothetical protein HYY06_04050 [Deltaproteobacteria bacterium]|nr:hypothetical protein [Deltaproteobacteria bacterium]